MYAGTMKPATLALTLTLAAALSVAATGQSLQRAASLQPAPQLEKADYPNSVTPAPGIQPAPGGAQNPPQPAPATGTGGDFALSTQVNGAGDPGARRKEAGTGDGIYYRVYSPEQSQKQPPLIVVQIHRTGAVLRSPYPGIAIDPSIESALAVIQADEEKPSLSHATGLSGTMVVQPDLEGLTMLMQGFSKSSDAANGIFESTEAHEIVFK